MKQFVEVARKWGDVNVSISIYDKHEDEGGKIVALQTGLVDFLAALKNEIGSVRYVFTDKEFDKRFDGAVLNVLNGIKETTVKYATEIPPDLI